MPRVMPLDRNVAMRLEAWRVSKAAQAGVSGESKKVRQRRALEAARRGAGDWGRYYLLDEWYERSAGVHGGLRSVSSFWTEKAVVLLDFVQCFALLWSLARAWPWPARWLQWTWPSLLASADFLSIYTWFVDASGQEGTATVARSPWGEATWLAYVLWALFGLLFVAGTWSYAKWRAAEAAEAAGERARGGAGWLGRWLWLMQLMYLPTAVLLSRAMPCLDGRLASDPTVSCFSPTHIALVAVAGTVAVALLVGFPLWLSRDIHARVIFTSSEEHEASIQLKEMEYLIGVNEEWHALHFSQFSSFRRPRVTYRVAVMWFKLGLVCIHTGMRWNLPAQSLVFLVWCFGWALWVTMSPPFRCSSSNWITLTLVWMLVYDCFIGLLSANGVRSALTVDSTLAAVLLFSHIGVAIWLAFIVFTATVSQTRWPTTARRTRTAVRKVELAGAPGLVPAIMDAQDMLEQLHGVPLPLVPIDVLNHEISRLHQLWLVARRTDCLLRHTAKDLLQDMVGKRDASKKWSVFPYPRLAKHMADFRARLDHRERELILVPRKRRRILLKLLCLRAIIGDRDISSVYKEERLKAIEDAARRAEEEAALKEAMEAELGLKAQSYMMDTMTVEELLEYTAKVLEAVPDVELLQKVKKFWRRKIKGWEKEFMEENGRQPSVRDKRQKRAWYESFHRLQKARKAAEEMDILL